MEATAAVSKRDPGKMTRDQAVAWFAEASDEDLAEVVRAARRPAPEAGRPAAAEAAIPLVLTSIRLPVELVGRLDEVAATGGLNRSEAIRAAVTAYVDERQGEVSAADAVHALEVLRRVVGEHIDGQHAA
jgi:predicted DNA-binding protein